MGEGAGGARIYKKIVHLYLLSNKINSVFRNQIFCPLFEKKSKGFTQKIRTGNNNTLGNFSTETNV